MTLKELEAWIARKKEIAALSGQVIDDYQIDDARGPIEVIEVDHGSNEITFRRW